MKNKLKVLLSLFAVCSVLGISTACDFLPFGDSSTESSVAESFTTSSDVESSDNVVESSDDVVESSDDVVESSDDVTESSDESSEEEAKYTATFMADGVEVSVVEFTESNKEITVPEVPVKEGYTGEWESYELGEDNIVINAVYTVITYTISFNHPKTGMPLAAPIEFTVETMEDIEFPAAPQDMATDGYEVAWDKTEDDITCADLIVYPTLVAIEYTVQFVHPKTGMIIAAPIKYTVENMAEVVFPEVPEEFAMEGYTLVWDKTEADLAIGGLTVSLAMTANTYKVTFDANGGECDLTEQDVTYDAEFTLPTATPAYAYQEFLGWFDQNGNSVEAGVWKVASDVTLIAKYSDGKITFDGMSEVPSYFSMADDTVSIEIYNLDGNNVLKMQAKDNGSTSTTSPALKVTLEFLTRYFSDESVDYLAFEAKSVKGNHNNFRRVTLRSNGSFAADCYDADLTHAITNGGTALPTSGIRNDAFKTFYFSRADYNAWVNQGVTEERIIASGQQQQGEIFYIDNIRPVTAAERLAAGYNFDNGGVRVNDHNTAGLEGGRTLLFYTSASGSDWDFNIQCDAATTFTNVGYSADNVTSGLRAVRFTKGAGAWTINLPSSKSSYANVAGSNLGFWAVDIYTPEDSDLTVKYQTTNWPGAVMKKGGWTTVYVRTSNGLGFVDTTGGTYLVDNIRAVSEDEFYAASRGFEMNVAGLRDNTESGNVFYVYTGDDHRVNRYSFAAVGGGGATLSNPNFNSEIVHDGTYSLSFTKTNGAMTIQMRADNNIYQALKNGFTFWLYTTVAINGKDTANFTNGHGQKLNGGEGMFIAANTWVQITITADDIVHGEGEGACAFLKLNGSTAGTYYIDNIQPLE